MTKPAAAALHLLRAHAVTSLSSCSTKAAGWLTWGDASQGSRQIEQCRESTSCQMPPQPMSEEKRTCTPTLASQNVIVLMGPNVVNSSRCHYLRNSPTRSLAPSNRLVSQHVCASAFYPACCSRVFPYISLLLHRKGECAADRQDILGTAMRERKFRNALSPGHSRWHGCTKRVSDVYMSFRSLLFKHMIHFSLTR
jgi:hypothetical protein